MKNEQVAAQLYALAELLEMEGVDFKPAAYRRAARSIIEADDIGKEAKKGKLEEIPGVGKHIAAKIEEFLKTGKIKKLKQLQKKSKIDITSFEGVLGLGPKKLAKLHKKLGIKNAKDLAKAAKAGKIRKLEGFGEKSEKAILEHLARDKNKRFLYGEALSAAKQIINQMKKHVDKIEYCGSLRRKKAAIGDVDLLAITNSPQKVIETFTKLPQVKKVLSKGKGKGTIITKKGIQVDLRVWKKNEYGSGLLYFTGSKDFNIKLRRVAISKGMKLSEYGLFKGKKVVASKTEKDIFKALGMKYVNPEKREV
jgi:DNA polymerase (family 10)